MGLCCKLSFTKKLQEHKPLHKQDLAATAIGRQSIDLHFFLKCGLFFNFCKSYIVSSGTVGIRGEINKAYVKSVYRVGIRGEPGPIGARKSGPTAPPSVINGQVLIISELRF
jgi:hypothetical protein